MNFTKLINALNLILSKNFLLISRNWNPLVHDKFDSPTKFIHQFCVNPIHQQRANVKIPRCKRFFSDSVSRASDFSLFPKVNRVEFNCHNIRHESCRIKPPVPCSFVQWHDFPSNANFSTRCRWTRRHFTSLPGSVPPPLLSNSNSKPETKSDRTIVRSISYTAEGVLQAG